MQGTIFNKYLCPWLSVPICLNEWELRAAIIRLTWHPERMRQQQPYHNWTMSCHTFDNNETLRMKSDVDVSKVCCYNLPSDASSSFSPGKMRARFYAPTIDMIAVAFENTNTSNIVTFMMILFPGVGRSFILPDPEVYEDFLL